MAHAREGDALQPVAAAGARAIARTFWGASWCANLERYSDYSNRLPRGRTYLRNGSVIDLRVAPGEVTALVSGSDIYTVKIGVERLEGARWRQLCGDCAGGIDSIVELLQGRFSKGVMEVLCRPGQGMFPEPSQISMRCSCPDWATMCKHVAATLYGIGARLDAEPELLFTLRGVDQVELISASAGGIEAAASGTVDDELAGEDLSALFGIELETAVPGSPAGNGAAKRAADAKARSKTGPAKRRAAKKTPARKTPARKAATKKTRPAPRPVAPSRRSPPPVSDPWVTAAELRGRGVPSHTVQSWLHQGLLEHSGERGIYVRTASSEALVEDFLERRSAAPKAGRRGGRRARVAEVITAQELLRIGLSRGTIQGWLQRGILGRSPDRGVYALTADARARIRDRR